MERFIFNHYDAELQRIQTMKPTELNGLEVYSGRALCLSEPCDVIQLDPELKSNWEWVIHHYSRISLSHTTQVVWDNHFEILNDFPNHDISAFIFSPEINKIRENFRWLKTVERMNSKNQFVKICEKIGIPTPKTWFFSTKEEVAKYQFPYPVYLKAATSVSGLGVARCMNRQDIELQFSTMSAGDFQVQEEIKDAVFLNLTYAIRNGKLEKIASTRQILNGFSHNGNTFPSGEIDPWHITDPIAEHLLLGGMLGTFGFDVAVTPLGCFAIECNPRFNGSVYPAIIASKLGINKWLATNITTKATSLNDMRFASLEYNKKTGKGVIVVNWGAVLRNKIGILISADNNEEQQWYIKELKRILS